eukprot:superscaffoldBa00001234_g9653
MDSTETEQNTTQSKEENNDADDPSSNDCGSERDSNVPHGPAGTQVWAGPPSDVSPPGMVPQPLQHSTQPGMVDPLSYRFHCLYQSSQCQLTYPDYLLEPQSSQYNLLTGPVPGPPDSSHHSSASAPWFTNEPILCSMMPGDLHAPVAGICVPQAMDHQQFQDGLTGVTSHITQPVVCNVSGGGQVVLVNPCDPGPVFFTLESAPAQRHDEQTQGKADVLGTPSQYHQTACPLYESRDQTANMQPQAPPARWDVSVITPAVVEAVCASLLAQAEEAEMEAQSLAQAEHMILDEFGHCLTQIVKAMSNKQESRQASQGVGIEPVTAAAAGGYKQPGTSTHSCCYWPGCSHCSRHDGRRFVSEDDNSVLKQDLQGWYAVLRVRPGESKV